MSQDSAKFILGAYRPDGRDAGDPAFGAALAEAGRDPALQAWFEKDQLFSSLARAKIREVAAPADLRAAILAGARFSRRTPWWKRRFTLALAAMFALLLALAPLEWRLVRPGFSKTLPEFAVNFASRGFIGLRFGKPGNDLEVLQSWLASRHAPLPAKIPAGLAQLAALGCRTVDFQGKNISVICFEREREYHLFIARREDFPGIPDNPQPLYATQRDWGSATWTDRDHRYVLVSSAGVGAIKSLL